MTRVLVLLAVILSSGIASNSLQAQYVSVPVGYVTGVDYREFSKSERMFYLIGTVDGFVAAALFDGKDAVTLWLNQCIKGVTSVQLTAIVDTFLDSHPERWDQGMNILAYGALLHACDKRGFGKPPLGNDGTK